MYRSAGQDVIGGAGQGSQRLKNRIASILLDSNFEIALKEFVVYRKDLFPPREFDDAKIKQLYLLVDGGDDQMSL